MNRRDFLRWVEGTCGRHPARNGGRQGSGADELFSEGTVRDRGQKVQGSCRVAPGDGLLQHPLGDAATVRQRLPEGDPEGAATTG